MPGGPSGQVSVRILRPQGTRRPLAAGRLPPRRRLVFGNHHTHDRLIRELAVGAQAAVVFPNYSLSPEANYPTALQECHAVARWIAEHGLEPGLDTSRIAIAVLPAIRHRLLPASRRHAVVLGPGQHQPRPAGRADRLPAIIHDFVMLNALADTNAARGAITLATDTLRAVLSDKH